MAKSVRGAKEEISIAAKGYKGLEAFHKYWGKKPVESWNVLISELSKPGDLLLDPFLGSGLVARESIEKNRNFIGIDINPISIELTKFFINPPKSEDLIEAFNNIENTMKIFIEKNYKLNDEIVSHLLWTENTLDEIWIKCKNKRVTIKPSAGDIKRFKNPKKYKIKHFREPQFFNNARINTNSRMTIHDLFSDRALEFIDLLIREIEKIKNTSVRRSLKLLLSSSVGQMSNMVFAVTSRGKNSGKVNGRIEVGSWVIGYWRPKTHFEVNPWNCFENKKDKMLKGLLESEMIRKIDKGNANLILGDSEKKLKAIKDATVQLILTDPPHGDRIPYLELSEMWNAILGFKVDFKNELVVSNAKERKKTDKDYTMKFHSIIRESLRILKKDGFLAVMFNSRNEEHWDALFTIKESDHLKFVGRYNMNYSAGSIVQDTRTGGLKNDYVLIFTKGMNQNRLEAIRTKLKVLPEWSHELPEVKNAS